jgi:hypothetical protein
MAYRSATVRVAVFLTATQETGRFLFSCSSVAGFR